MKRPLIRLFYLVASLALVSLNNNAAAHASPLQPLREEAPAAPSVIYLPMVRYDYIYLPPIIPETTNVLTVTTTQHLAEISSPGSVFTFTQRTPALDSLTAGDVIVGEPTMAAPSGFLRRVAAISSTGSQVVVRTDPATLEEAIQQGTAQVSQILSSENVLSETRSRGVISGSAPLAAGQGRFYLDLTDVVLYDEDGNLGTTDDQITANGSLVLKPGFNFRILVKDWQLKRLNFTIDVTETAELQIDAGVEVPLIQQEVEIASYTFAPIVVMIGPFPIWFTPELAVNVGLDGSVNIGVSSGVTQEATLTAGVKYDHEGYGPIQGLANSFQYNLPTLYASMDMKGYAGVELSLKLFGRTGALADANLYLELEADPTADPWWQLYDGLEAKAGVEMEIFSYQIASYETPAMGYRWLLTQATGPANLLDNPGFEGSRGNLLAGIRVRGAPPTLPRA